MYHNHIHTPGLCIFSKSNSLYLIFEHFQHWNSCDKLHFSAAEGHTQTQVSSRQRIFYLDNILSKQFI